MLICMTHETNWWPWNEQLQGWWHPCSNHSQLTIASFKFLSLFRFLALVFFKFLCKNVDMEYGLDGMTSQERVHIVDPETSSFVCFASTIFSIDYICHLRINDSLAFCRIFATMRIRYSWSCFFCIQEMKSFLWFAFHLQR